MELNAAAVVDVAENSIFVTVSKAAPNNNKQQGEQPRVFTLVEENPQFENSKSLEQHTSNYNRVA